MQFRYKCTECGRVYEISPDIMLCPDCSQKWENDKPLSGVLEVLIPSENIALDEQSDVFNFLPVDRRYFPKIPVGNTPLWEPVNLRRLLGMPNLYIKDDTLNPTASLKDRASFLVAAFAKKHSISDVVVASSGNAAASMAGIGAAAGLNVTIFLPKNAPRAKIVQALQYGARVIPVDGNYDMAFDFSLKYSNARGGLSRNTAYNPLTIEGKKTVALEIFLQLGDAPDCVFVPTGDGVILAGTYKGFRDLKKLGLIEQVPKIFAVQADGSSAICRAMHTGNFDIAISSHTIADSISVDAPKNGYFALNLLRKYDGECITVSDEAILNSQRLLSSSTGLFAEPAASAALAGLLTAKGKVERDAKTVLLITGSGLKDIDAAAKGIQFTRKAIKSMNEIL